MPAFSPPLGNPTSTQLTRFPGQQTSSCWNLGTGAAEVRILGPVGEGIPTTRSDTLELVPGFVSSVTV